MTLFHPKKTSVCSCALEVSQLSDFIGIPQLPLFVPATPFMDEESQIEKETQESNTSGPNNNSNANQPLSLLFFFLNILASHKLPHLCLPLSPSG